MLERQVSVALEGGPEDNLERAFDSELQRIIQFYHKKVCLWGMFPVETGPASVRSCLACYAGFVSGLMVPQHILCS